MLLTYLTFKKKNQFYTNEINNFFFWKKNFNTSTAVWDTTLKDCGFIRHQI